jgi:hypothetical protein
LRPFLKRLTRTAFVFTALAAVIVPSALALAFTDDSSQPPQGVVGQPYTHSFEGTGGCGPGLPYQFKVISGELPAGLTLQKDGLLSGTPTQAGSSSFWVELSDEDPPSAPWCVPMKAERQFTVTIVEAAQDPGHHPPDRHETAPPTEEPTTEKPTADAPPAGVPAADVPTVAVPTMPVSDDHVDPQHPPTNAPAPASPAEDQYGDHETEVPGPYLHPNDSWDLLECLIRLPGFEASRV